ncbi:cupin domain-containing protein [Hyphomicrobium sp. B1]|uniref:cupin domain-containing protein n=1 Tax=Hyphomicrobium sp. B1 TaxID=3075651 RepID=UPI003C2FA034
MSNGDRWKNARALMCNAGRSNTLVAGLALASLCAWHIVHPSLAIADPIAPTLSGAPEVTDIPDRGTQPTISNHTALMPQLYKLDAQPVEQISPLVQRQMLHGTQSTFVKWTVKKGGVFPLHHHANEQITWITEGQCEVLSQGKKFVVSTGSVLVIPPNVPHEFHCTEDTIDIDFFSPQRQDWIDGAASVAAMPK